MGDTIINVYNSGDGENGGVAIKDSDAVLKALSIVSDLIRESFNTINLKLDKMGNELDVLDQKLTDLQSTVDDIQGKCTTAYTDLHNVNQELKTEVANLTAQIQAGNGGTLPEGSVVVSLDRINAISAKIDVIKADLASTTLDGSTAVQQPAPVDTTIPAPDNGSTAPADTTTVPADTTGTDVTPVPADTTTTAPVDTTGTTVADSGTPPGSAPVTDQPW